MSNTFNELQEIIKKLSYYVHVSEVMYWDMRTVMPQGGFDDRMNTLAFILQDMHWSDGSFGYFPSYLLGSIYDGMYLDAITEELGDVDKILSEGRIKEITKWLNEKIHRFGSTRLPADVIENVCGKPLSAEPLVRYFTEK